MAPGNPDGQDELDALRERLDRMNHEIVSEEEERESLAEARKLARSHPGFRAWLRALPPVRDGTRAMVVEALASDLDAHGALLLEEFDAALARVEEAADPRDLLYPFLDLTDAAGSSHARPIRDRLAALLGSAAPAARCWAADMIEEFVDPSDTELVLRLRTLLEQDADWRVRGQARRTLEALGLLPPDHRPRLLDRVRARLLSRR